MDALEAKTCENRRFWGRFQKDLIVWKQHDHFERIVRVSFLFQKDLIVWKHFSHSIKSVIWTEFQKDLIVWKPLTPSIVSILILYVSEGLNSVETFFLYLRHLSPRSFQKDLIVWKHGLGRADASRIFDISEGLNSVETSLSHTALRREIQVSEGLNSVETSDATSKMEDKWSYVSEGLNSVETFFFVYLWNFSF